MKLFKTAVMLTFGLTLGLLAGCSDDDGIDNRDLDYGYVQFKLYKEASYEAPQDDAAQSRAIKPQLDYLAEASKVQVTLTSGEETIVQTLTLSAADAESAEYGMRSAKLKLLTGNYTITRFTLFDAEDGDSGGCLTACLPFPRPSPTSGPGRNRPSAGAGGKP